MGHSDSPGASWVVRTDRTNRDDSGVNKTHTIDSRSRGQDHISIRRIMDLLCTVHLQSYGLDWRIPLQPGRFANEPLNFIKTNLQSLFDCYLGLENLLS
jgi:hypothetical protein